MKELEIVRRGYLEQPPFIKAIKTIRQEFDGVNTQEKVDAVKWCLARKPDIGKHEGKDVWSRKFSLYGLAEIKFYYTFTKRLIFFLHAEIV